MTKVEEDLNVVELVTDASSSVKKLLGKKKQIITPLRHIASCLFFHLYSDTVLFSLSKHALFARCHKLILFVTASEKRMFAQAMYYFDHQCKISAAQRIQNEL